MGHHHHGHDHGDHDHRHDDHSMPVSSASDAEVPDAELSPAEHSRRSLFRRAGLLGAGAAGASVIDASGADAGAPSPTVEALGKTKGAAGYQWLAGDHHIHTQYSPDAVYRVIDQVQHGNAYGLDWMVITDHGTEQHAKIGVEKTNPDIRAAREEVPETLVFQGLEWNIPAAEHGTVFVHPGDNEVATLKEFENGFDGSVTGTSDDTPANEALAVAGLTFLADAVRDQRIRDALFFANHPARRGVDSPHEIRAWRDAAPEIARGFEGAPGHQAAGIPQPFGAGSGRGFYTSSPGAGSFPGYPLESYRTFGGFDWMTATVGGLWDSLLAEGKPWWITANSDAHWVYREGVDRGPDSDFERDGYFRDPVYLEPVNTSYGDFWPGYYSKTHVGSADFSYAAVMDGLRAGRIWVDHGGLIAGLDVEVRRPGQRPGQGTTLGGVHPTRPGERVELAVTVTLANRPNWAQFVPRLARVDVIRGDVMGPAGDPDTFTTPNTAVVESYDVKAGAPTLTFTHDLGRVESSIYVRLRGSDGNRTADGLLGATVDPVAPSIDVLGDADPWLDLWFYANPIWIITQ